MLDAMCIRHRYAFQSFIGGVVQFILPKTDQALYSLCVIYCGRV